MIPAEIVVGVVFLGMLYLLLKGSAKRDALKDENKELRQRVDDLTKQLGDLASSVIEHDQAEPRPAPKGAVTTKQTRRPQVGDDIPR